MNPRQTHSSTSTDSDYDELRTNLLDTTVTIIREEGLEALSLRDVADRANTSTQMIYTIFGNKNELLKALYDRGAKQLADRCKALENQETPLHRLYELGRVYREFALEHRKIYSAMFDPNLVDEGLVRRTEVFKIFERVIDECQSRGYLSNADSAELTDALWSAAHGSVSLQIAGFYENPSVAEDRYNQALRAVFKGFGGHLPDSLPF